MRPTLTVTIYRDSNHEWRFRVRARNNAITLGPSEGYKTKRGCLLAVERLHRWAGNGDLIRACGRVLEANGH